MPAVDRRRRSSPSDGLARLQRFVPARTCSRPHQMVRPVFSSMALRFSTPAGAKRASPGRSLSPAERTTSWSRTCTIAIGRISRHRGPTGGCEARVTGTIALAAGAHNIVVAYVHDRDRPHFQLSWSRGGSPPGPVPAWALRPHRARSFAGLIAGASVYLALALVEWIWVT